MAHSLNQSQGEMYFLFSDFTYLFLEREREKERERNINVWLLLAHPLLGDLARNPGICPAWELNW